MPSHVNICEPQNVHITTNKHNLIMFKKYKHITKAHAHKTATNRMPSDSLIIFIAFAVKLINYIFETQFTYMQ